MWEDFLRCLKLPPDLQDSAHANFVAWERLRLYYNGALVALTLGIGLVGSVVGLSMGPSSIADLGGRILMLGLVGIFGVVPMNIAFCVGPVVEGYLVRWRLDRGFARTLLFFAGLLVGAGMASVTALGIMAAP